MHTQRLLLRPWTEADAACLHEAFGDAETMRFWDGAPARDVAETAARIRLSRAANPLGHGAFAAVLRAEGKIVGMVNYHDHHPAHRRLAIGWVLLPGWRRMGLAQEAAAALMRRCFTGMGMNRIEARIEPGNAPSLALADRLGFRREGLLREWMVVAGVPRDIVLMAVLRKDWDVSEGIAVSRLLHRSGSIPPIAVGGEGIYLHTKDGRRIIDGSGGAAVACLGHGNRRVAEAVGRQAASMAYAHTGTFSNEPAEALAEIVLGEQPGGLARAWFCSSGSEGNEAAIKLVRQYFLEIGQPSRVHTIARRQSYHGTTLGALAAGGNMMRRAHYEPILSRTHSLVSPCFAYRFQAEGETDAQYLDRLAAELVAEFERVGPERVMAFLAEPVVGATTGCVTALPGYFRRVREICDRYGALLVLDEVMCGMGRTGTMHAWEQEGVVPDVQVIAKGLGGGYQPIGGVLIAERIVQALDAGSGGFLHGQTYQAHPVACSAALEVQRIIREDGLLANVRAMGERLETALQERFGNHRHVGDIRGRGLFWALEFVADRGSKAVFDPALKLNERVKAAALERGLATYPMGGTIDGVRGDHLILAPPYIVTSGDVDTIVARLGEAVDAAFSGLGG